MFQGLNESQKSSKKSNPLWRKLKLVVQAAGIWGTILWGGLFTAAILIYSTLSLAIALPLLLIMSVLVAGFVEISIAFSMFENTFDNKMNRGGNTRYGGCIALTSGAIRFWLTHFDVNTGKSLGPLIQHPEMSELLGQGLIVSDNFGAYKSTELGHALLKYIASQGQNQSTPFNRYGN